VGQKPSVGAAGARCESGSSARQPVAADCWEGLFEPLAVWAGLPRDRLLRLPYYLWLRDVVQPIVGLALMVLSPVVYLRSPVRAVWRHYHAEESGP
jgi:hypothetical protein